MSEPIKRYRYPPNELFCVVRKEDLDLLEREVVELREARTSITSEMVNALDSIQRFGWFQTGMFARGSGEWIQYKDFATVRSMFEAILKRSP